MTSQTSQTPPNSEQSNPKQSYLQRPALRFAIAYALIASLWFIFSVQIVQFISPDPDVRILLIAIKDWLFVLISAIALYSIISRLSQAPLTPVKPLLETLPTPEPTPILAPAPVPTTSSEPITKKQDKADLVVRAHQQEVVAHLGQSALVSLDLDTLFNQATTAVTRTLGADLSKVLELLPETKEFLLRAGVGWKDGLIGTCRVPADEETQAGFTLKSNEPIIVPNLQIERRFSSPPLLHDHNVVSSLSVVIPGHERPFGVLSVHSIKPLIFTRNDSYFLQAVANVLAAAIERARTEQALRDSEERSRTIVSTAADGIITIDDQGLIRTFNPAAERLFGFTAKEAIGEPVNRFISKPVNDPSGDTFGWRKNGRSFPIDLTVSEMNINGKRMVTHIVRDITEQVQATEAVGRHIRQLSILNRVLQVASAPLGFEGMLDALLTEISEVFNADATDIHLMDANVGLLYLLAYRGWQLSDDQKYQHLPIEKSMRGAAIQKGHVVTLTAPLSLDLDVSPEQADKIKAIAITPIWAGGQLRGTLAVTLLTERRFSEEELALLEGLGRGVGITIENARIYAEAQSYAETLKIKIEERTQELQKALVHAQSADRTKSALVSTVSHEMRTPLSSIIGFSNLIISRRPDMDKTLEYSVAINSEARRLSDLINDFLDLQRLESGREVFHYTEVDIADLTRDIIRKQQFDEDSRHTIRLEMKPVPWVYADPNRLRQVILNLLSNAVKYSPNGGEILISLWSENDEVFFSIHDEGLGITPDDMQRIFDHFYRGDAAERYRIRGTGLGLGLCKEIIQIHNGRIWGDSPGLNQGSTFTFALPNLQPKQSRRRKSDTNENRPFIVTIEDDMHFASYLSDRLDIEGFDTQVVHFKAATANYIGQIEPSLIILDLLQGEEQSGWSVLANLRRFPATRNIPVIVCSSLEASIEADEAGADSFIRKPIDELKLINEIRRLISPEPDGNPNPNTDTSPNPEPKTSS